MATANYTPPAYTAGFHDPETYLARTPKGLSEETVRAISAFKQEPEWMLEKRLEGYRIFLEKSLPTWGADLSSLNFEEMTYFLRAQDKPARDWDDVKQHNSHPDSNHRTSNRPSHPSCQ